MSNFITEKDNLQKQYLDVLSTTRSTLLKEYDLKKILFNETWYCLAEKKSILKSIIKTLVFTPCTLTSDICNKSILTFYSVLHRIDHDKYWELITDDLGDHDTITVDHSFNKNEILGRLSFKFLMKKFRWLLIFFKELKDIKPFISRLYLASQLADRKWLLTKIQQLDLHPKVVMCFFDSGKEESLIMQYFKKQGAVTVTNQHGQPVYLSNLYDRMNQSQILNFKCDYFLAKGAFTAEQFVNAGYGRHCIKLLGIVGKNTNGKKNNKFTRTFGVYLDYPGFPFAQESNKLLISMAEKISAKKHLKYFIKLHPSDDVRFYDFNKLSKNCIQIFDKKEPLKNTFDIADFSIIHASATYLDSYKYGLRALKLCTDINYPIADSIDCFNSSDELSEIIDDWYDSTELARNTIITNVLNKYETEWNPGKVKKLIHEMIQE